jgi:hypothetical protein
MRRSVLAAVVAALSLAGCYVREPAYMGPDRHAYRHARWHGEHVYKREDGRWYARRHDEWVLRPEVVIE